MAKDALSGTFIPLMVFDSVTVSAQMGMYALKYGQNPQIIPAVHLYRTSSVAE